MCPAPSEGETLRGLRWIFILWIELMCMCVGLCVCVCVCVCVLGSNIGVVGTSSRVNIINLQIKGTYSYSEGLWKGLSLKTSRDRARLVTRVCP